MYSSAISKVANHPLTRVIALGVAFGASHQAHAHEIFPDIAGLNTKTTNPTLVREAKLPETQLQQLGGQIFTNEASKIEKNCGTSGVFNKMMDALVSQQGKPDKITQIGCDNYPAKIKVSTPAGQAWAEATMQAPNIFYKDNIDTGSRFNMHIAESEPPSLELFPNKTHISKNNRL